MCHVIVSTACDLQRAKSLQRKKQQQELQQQQQQRLGGTQKVPPTSPIISRTSSSAAEANGAVATTHPVAHQAAADAASVVVPSRSIAPSISREAILSPKTVAVMAATATSDSASHSAVDLVDNPTSNPWAKVSSAPSPVAAARAAFRLAEQRAALSTEASLEGGTVLVNGGDASLLPVRAAAAEEEAESTVSAPGTGNGTIRPTDAEGTRGDTVAGAGSLMDKGDTPRAHIRPEKSRHFQPPMVGLPPKAGYQIMPPQAAPIPLPLTTDSLPVDVVLSHPSLVRGLPVTAEEGMLLGKRMPSTPFPSTEDLLASASRPTTRPSARATWVTERAKEDRASSTTAQVLRQNVPAPVVPAPAVTVTAPGIVAALESTPAGGSRAPAAPVVAVADAYVVAGERAGEAAGAAAGGAVTATDRYPGILARGMGGVMDEGAAVVHAVSNTGVVSVRVEGGRGRGSAQMPGANGAEGESWPFLV